MNSFYIARQFLLSFTSSWSYTHLVWSFYDIFYSYSSNFKAISSLPRCSLPLNGHVILRVWLRNDRRRTKFAGAALERLTESGDSRDIVVPIAYIDLATNARSTGKIYCCVSRCSVIANRWSTNWPTVAQLALTCTNNARFRKRSSLHNRHLTPRSNSRSAVIRGRQPNRTRVLAASNRLLINCKRSLLSCHLRKRSCVKHHRLIRSAVFLIFKTFVWCGNVFASNITQKLRNDERAF